VKEACGWVLGFVACVLLAVIASQTKGVTEAEEGMRIGQDLDECQAKCPPLQFSRTDRNGEVIEPDNSARERCSSECEGASKAKFKSLLGRRQ
jgi:hypothetical protein